MTHHDLVLHVGMPRSSAIVGPALRRLRPQLRARGVAYIGGAEIGRLPGAEGWLRGPAATRESDAFVRQLAAYAEREKHAAGGLWRRDTIPVVVAGDELLGLRDLGHHDLERFRPNAVRSVAQVAQALSAHRIRILLHTHRQDRLIELAYARWLRSGRHGTIEDFFPAVYRPVVDYGDLIARLRTVPQVVDVVARPVEIADAGAQAFVNDTLDAIGLRDSLDLSAMGAEMPVHPPMYSSRGVALANAMNPLVDDLDQLALVRTFLTRSHSAQLEYGTPEILDPASRSRILAAYDDANRRLFAEHMPKFRCDGYADDVATFDLANTLGQPPPYAPAVRARIALAAAVRRNRATGAPEHRGPEAGRLPARMRQRLAAYRA